MTGIVASNRRTSFITRWTTRGETVGAAGGEEKGDLLIPTILAKDDISCPGICLVTYHPSHLLPRLLLRTTSLREHPNGHLIPLLSFNVRKQVAGSMVSPLSLPLLGSRSQRTLRHQTDSWTPDTVFCLKRWDEEVLLLLLPLLRVTAEEVDSLPPPVLLVWQEGWLRSSGK